MNPYPYLKKQLFEKLKTQKVHPYSIAIYDVLLMVCNATFWKTTFDRTDESIYSILGISCNTFKKYRDELVELKLIDFLGEKPVTYKIIDLEKYKKTATNSLDFEENLVEEEPIFESIDVSNGDSANKTDVSRRDSYVSRLDTSNEIMCHPLTVDVSRRDSIIRHNTLLILNNTNTKIKTKKLAVPLNYDFIDKKFSSLFYKWLEYKKQQFNKTFRSQYHLEKCYNDWVRESLGDLSIAGAMIDHSIGMKYEGIFPSREINELIKNKRGDSKNNGFKYTPPTDLID